MRLWDGGCPPGGSDLLTEPDGHAVLVWNAGYLPAWSHPTAANQRVGTTGVRCILGVLGASLLGVLDDIDERLDGLPRGQAASNEHPRRLRA